jgi:hypothetical protein
MVETGKAPAPKSGSLIDVGTAQAAHAAIARLGDQPNVVKEVERIGLKIEAAINGEQNDVTVLALGILLESLIGAATTAEPVH